MLICFDLKGRLTGGHRIKMLKTYNGYSLPGPHLVNYSIEWSCSACASTNVERDPDDTRALHWCDGAPSTEDQLRRWICHACGSRAEGGSMAQSRTEIA
jgi:hypothetical protein